MKEYFKNKLQKSMSNEKIKKKIENLLESFSHHDHIKIMFTIVLKF